MDFNDKKKEDNDRDPNAIYFSINSKEEESSFWKN